MDYVERFIDDWVELHGDRGRADDGALVTGLGSLDGRTIVLIGHQKGRDVKERLDRQFGMAYPEGYVKAMRVMEIAERFSFPVISLVDTPGAYPGVAAEQHGQGGAIARSQAEMARLTVPTIACIIGEGGSGGAVAIAVSDRVLMQENAIYSVITPGGLRRDPLARRGRGEEGGRRVQARRAALPRARGDRRRSSPSPRAAPTPTTTKRRACCARRWSSRWRSWRKPRARSCAARRRAKFRGMGVYA